MSVLLLPNEVLSMTAQAARRLVDAGDGDCALLYLALLQAGSNPDQAATQLGWDPGRMSAAFARLTAMGLAQGSCPGVSPAPQTAPVQDDRPPEYTRGDIADALEQEQSFYGLSREMERLLGRVFSDTDLKSLYTIYDYLALPVEVIFMLAGYVVRASRRQKGDASPLPRMTEVKREAFRWKRLGITTVERAEEYLRDQESIDQREWGVLSAVGVTQKRPAIDKEREYIHRWVQWGFSDEMIHLAYERTIFRKGQMNWPYVNKILESWKKSGYTTPQQVEQERGGKPNKAQPQTQGARPQEDYQPSASRIQQQADWLAKFLQEQEKGGN